MAKPRVSAESGEALGRAAAARGGCVIRYHYHTARKDIPRLGISRGDPLCHVYSDVSREELEAWGRRHGLETAWIHDSTLPHFDAFGARLEWCGPGVTRAELKKHIRAWRARGEAK